MKIKIFIERLDKTLNIDLRKGSTIIDLLNKLGIRGETVVIMKNKRIILPETKLKPRDKIELLSVISGG